jgi:hypothetical protein
MNDNENKEWTGKYQALADALNRIGARVDSEGDISLIDEPRTSNLYLVFNPAADCWEVRR